MSLTPASHFGPMQRSTSAILSNTASGDPTDAWGQKYGLDAEECGYL